VYSQLLLVILKARRPPVASTTAFARNSRPATLAFMPIAPTTDRRLSAGEGSCLHVHVDA
jgi:hypothetical protein